MTLSFSLNLPLIRRYKVPYSVLPSQWTRTLTQTLWQYTYSQWIVCNTFVHGPTHSAFRATHCLSLMTPITEAYNNSSSTPIDELSFTFGIPLTLQLEQTTNIMEAWLLQFQAGQKDQANILKQVCCNQGKIKIKSSSSAYMVATLKNHLIKRTALIYLTYILTWSFWPAWNWRSHAYMMLVVCSNWRVRGIPNVNDSSSIGVEELLL